MLYSVPCCEVQQFFFFWRSMGRRWAIRTLNFKEVSYENVNFHNNCSDNLEPNLKDNSEYAVLCSLLRGSPDFFFWLSMVMRSAITTLKLKEVSTVNGTFPELQTALSIFQKQVAIAESGSPLTLFQLQDLSTVRGPFSGLRTVALSIVW